MKIQNKKRFAIFIIMVVCFLLSGVYLAKKIIDFREASKEANESNDSRQEEVNELSEESPEVTGEVLEETVVEGGSELEQMKELAVFQYDQKKYEESEANFKKLLEEDPENAFAHYNSLANIYRDQEKIEKAIEYYQKAIEDNPEYEIAYQNLALFYLYAISPQEIKKAQAVVAQGLENLPDSEVLKKLQD